MQLARVVADNRRALKAVDDWLPDNMLAQSVFRYGVNPDVEPLINLPLDANVTHADLLAYFGQRLQKPCAYLELGVSVGKSLWQILNACAPCRCWGFDIEEINPALSRNLVQISRQEFSPPAASIKQTPSSLTRFLHPPSGSTVTYLCGDILDKEAWKLFSGEKFNLILSDALHTPEALALEWNQLTDLHLLDADEAVIMWDDLDGPMHDWFRQNRALIAEDLAVSADNLCTLFANGWLGRREYPHRLGIAMKIRS
jgi:hypothetical protein